MSHAEQFGYFSAVVEANKELVDGAKVLEIGSYDVNGSVRNLFANAATYVGVDLDEGPGVDHVGFGHEVDHPEGTYDVTLSGECFEHDPLWKDTFANMTRMTRPGGMVVFTCASRGRPEHGTQRTNKVLSPGTQSVGIDYYRNLDAEDFEKAMPMAELFSTYKFWYLPTHFDLYFAGIRAGEPSGVVAKLPDEGAVQSLKSVMTFPHKAARAPLRMLAKVMPDDRYQSAIRPYWRTLQRVAGDRHED